MKIHEKIDLYQEDGIYEKYEPEYIDPSKNNKYVVECDGYDYHSSKKQQAYDNQRQRDIENAGYTVIRFSGKEIFDDEVKCVYETLKRLDIEVKQ